VIAKTALGSDVGGLLRYLFGPGRANEHTSPHLVAAWNEDWLPGGDLGDDLHGLRRGGLARLARMLDAPRRAHDVPADRHVYHVSISLPPDDGQRGDAWWREVVEAAVAALGLVDRRWVAVHHGLSAGGNDHVHLVVQLVGRGGRAPDLWRERLRWRNWCRQVEDRYGLTPTAPAGAGRRGVGRREAQRDRRAGNPVGAGRNALVRHVHTVAAGVTSVQEFAQRLRRRGVAVRLRRDQHGHITGYAIALISGDGRLAGPWISGSRLRRDLSLPRLRARWAQTPATGPAGQDELTAQLAAVSGELWDRLRQYGFDPGVWHAAALAVADAAVVAARWQPALYPVAAHLAMTAQPARHHRRRNELWLPVTRQVLHAVQATGRIGPVVTAALVLAVAALIVVLVDALHHEVHPAARRHLTLAQQRAELIAETYRNPAPPARAAPTPAPKLSRESAGALANVFGHGQAPARQPATRPPRPLSPPTPQRGPQRGR
jgi:relaxase-like protein